MNENSEKGMPSLSIITINLNNKEGLIRTVESVRSQIFKDYEHIVIDGKSTDGSVSYLNENRELFSYLVSEQDEGIYNAQNKGWRRAAGKYCLFLNSGDVLLKPESLKTAFAHEFDEDLVYGNLMIDYGGEVVEGIQPDILTLEHLYFATLWHPATFIKRSLLEYAGGFSEEYRIVSDYEFFLRSLVEFRASSKHIPVSFALFDTTGIGSSKEYEDLHLLERKSVQEKVLAPVIIDLLKQKQKCDGKLIRIKKILKYTGILPLLRLVK